MQQPPRFDPWSHWYRRALPAYWIFMACVTHFPKLTIPGKIPQSDKLSHFGGYGILTFLFWRFFAAFNRPPGHRFWWISLLVIATYAAIDEWTQPIFGRDCDILDWTADAIGAGLVIAFLEFRRLSACRKESHAQTAN